MQNCNVTKGTAIELPNALSNFVLTILTP